MRRLCALLLGVLLLCGCDADSALDQGMGLRSELLTADGCQFDAVITADYGDTIYTFGMSCQGDAYGNLDFQVTEPQSIAGITGRINAEGGKLTFDDHALGFQVLADGQISPVSAPWFILTALRSGYIKACESSAEGLHMIINDSYAEDALQVDIYADQETQPIRGEILWRGRRILSLQIRNYTVL